MFVEQPKKITKVHRVSEQYYREASKGIAQLIEHHVDILLRENLLSSISMRWRIGLAWALIIAGVGLAFLLVSACHPGFTTTTPAGMSAPMDPAPSIESALATQLLRLQSDGHGQALRVIDLSFALETVCATNRAGQDSGPAQPHYGPLHRRPPPSLS